MRARILHTKNNPHLISCNQISEIRDMTHMLQTDVDTYMSRSHIYTYTQNISAGNLTSEAMHLIL